MIKKSSTTRDFETFFVLNIQTNIFLDDEEGEEEEGEDEAEGEEGE